MDARRFLTVLRDIRSRRANENAMISANTSHCFTPALAALAQESCMERRAFGALGEIQLQLPIFVVHAPVLVERKRLRSVTPIKNHTARTRYV